ncbi:MAG: hypothetical protein K5978_07980 [Campylobacter sp.]|nr:hypothetical protein [Campylobacter sp.]
MYKYISNAQILKAKLRDLSRRFCHDIAKISKILSLANSYLDTKSNLIFATKQNIYHKLTKRKSDERL